MRNLLSSIIEFFHPLSPQERYYRKCDEALRQEKAEQHPHEREQEKSSLF